MIQVKNNSSYYINARALSFAENDLANPQRVSVSLTSGTSILVHIPGIIDYAADGSYEKWTLRGYSTKLLKNDAYFIFARLSRTERTALIIFSVNDYDINGRAEVKGVDENGNETVTTVGPSEDYYYLKLGTLTATDGTSLRELTYDSGLLSTDKGRDQSGASDMFELDKISVPPLIKVKQWFYEFTVKNPITLLSGILFGEKKVTDIKRSMDEDLPLSDETIPSTRYASIMNDGKYIRKDQDDRTEHSLGVGEDLTVDGAVYIGAGADIAGSADIGGDATIQGSADIGGDTTIHGSADIGGDTTIQGSADIKDKITIGDFIEEGDIIQGAQVTKEGIGSFAGLKSTFMQIYELILNRKTAVQGEFAFSDGDTVESVTLNDDGTYTLALREQYPKYITSFKKDDIIYANINRIGESGSSALTGKCWMRVQSVADDGLHLTVMLYGNDSVPAGKNLEPQPLMMITRHGNATDKERQNVWVISSEDGRMYQLVGVTNPIIGNECYGVVVGKLPATLANKVKLLLTNFNADHPYFYARGAVIQDLVLMDYKGQVIRTENYRGAWSADTAENNPYVVNSTTYDTVTHNGSKWAVNVSNTKIEPQQNVAEWTLVVSRGEAEPYYVITPSVNIVNVHKDGLSTDSIDIVIGETSSQYTSITTQDELDERGLKVQYSIDDNATRHDLIIGGDIEVLDESGDFVFEDESSEGVLALEGESLDISSIKNNITLYLVDIETGVDKAQNIVPVVRDGSNGENGHSYELRLSHNILSVLVDATSGKTVSESKFLVDVIYEIDNVAQELNNEDNVQISWDGGSVNALHGIVGGVLKCAIQVLAGIEPTTKNITISVTPKGFPTAYATVSLSYPQRGLVGPAGETGAMLYPAGTWNRDFLYTQTYGENGKVELTPFVYYENSEGAYDYYVLVKDIEQAGTDITNIQYWKRVQKIEYLFAKGVIANWARLASFVVWGDYLLSEKGFRTDTGEIADYSAFVEDMFTDERLNGTFVPNLFLDAKSGMVKTNKFSETFRAFRKSFPSHSGYPSDSNNPFADILNLETSYNVKCQSGLKMLMMPLLTDILATDADGKSVTVVPAEPVDVDGIHSVISVFPDVNYESGVTSNMYSENNIQTPSYAWGAVVESCVLLCADPRIFSRHSYKRHMYGYDFGTYDGAVYAPNNTVKHNSAYYTDDLDMFFSMGGTLTKWILLEPGATVNLRLIESDGKHIWIVENSTDFDQLDVQVGILFDTVSDSTSSDPSVTWITGGVIGVGNDNVNDDEQDLGKDRTGRFYGSKRLRQLYDRNNGVGYIGVHVKENNNSEGTGKPISIADDIFSIINGGI